jgi:hypothetical protein
VNLVDLNERYDIIEEELKKMSLTAIEKDVLRNGKQVIFALLGVLYSLINQDIKEADIVNDTNIVRDYNFIYASIIGNYANDDIDELLKEIVTAIVTILGESYEKSLSSGDSTSISNYFKTDKKYIEKVLVDFVKYYTRLSIGKDLKDKGKIFKRNTSPKDIVTKQLVTV